MSQVKIGDRVYAVRDVSDEAVNLYGVGKFLGDCENELFMQEFVRLLGRTREFKDLDETQKREKIRELGLGKNPKIELDNGQIVWGYQCWWGPESELAKFTRKVKVVPLEV